MLIEQVIKEYLDEELSVDAFLEIPDPLPESFVVFRIADRGKTDQIEMATVEILSYAQSKYAAAALDEEVRELMEEIASRPDIACRFGGGSDSNDSTLKMYRYRCYINLYF